MHWLKTGFYAQFSLSFDRKSFLYFKTYYVTLYDIVWILFENSLPWFLQDLNEF